MSEPLVVPVLMITSFPSLRERHSGYVQLDAQSGGRSLHPKGEGRDAAPVEAFHNRGLEAVDLCRDGHATREPLQVDRELEDGEVVMIIRKDMRMTES